MPTLREELAAIRRSAEGDGTKPGRIPPDLLKVMHKVTADQQASGYRNRLPAIGTKAPSFTLPTIEGNAVASSDLLGRGHLVVSFFRGAW
ncbi:MAG TPA: hypothetical protein VHB27_21485 [Rhodopila sp.]|uniref:hypothetical protein n=1 Tax=Rhodopila sp. TaxID=2480087 RepID=UPI002C031E5F|nr:hypothetical protein [Rhodopila sp.]HVY17807.1 hypothetical protein [Rhodopila sp.]